VETPLLENGSLNRYQHAATYGEVTAMSTTRTVATRPLDDPAVTIPDGFVETFVDFRPRLLRMLKGDSADDDADEVLVRALSRPALVPPNPTYWRPWILTVARHIRLDRIRALGRAPFLPYDEEKVRDGADEELCLCMSLDFRRAWLKLAPGDREVLDLRYVAGFGTREIANALGITAGAAGMRVRRAAVRLLAIVQESRS
jgi:DNA-directed RNA polymerase specialized sigma24 family protein